MRFILFVFLFQFIARCVALFFRLCFAAGQAIGQILVGGITLIVILIKKAYSLTSWGRKE